MKTAAFGEFKRVWNIAPNSLKPSSAFHLNAGYGHDKEPCIRVQRIVKDFLGRPFFDDFSCIHHGDSLSDLRYDAKIMSD